MSTALLRVVKMLMSLKAIVSSTLRYKKACGNLVNRQQGPIGFDLVSNDVRLGAISSSEVGLQRHIQVTASTAVGSNVTGSSVKPLDSPSGAHHESMYTKPSHEVLLAVRDLSKEGDICHLCIFLNIWCLKISISGVQGAVGIIH
jgi:hypothetical protein